MEKIKGEGTEERKGTKRKKERKNLEN